MAVCISCNRFLSDFLTMVAQLFQCNSSDSCLPVFCAKVDFFVYHASDLSNFQCKTKCKKKVIKFLSDEWFSFYVKREKVLFLNNLSDI